MYCLFFRCWLSTENNFIWSFIGPACLIILVSIYEVMRIQKGDDLLVLKVSNQALS